MPIKKLQKLYADIKNTPLLIASKTRTIEEIEPLLNIGHRLFGENRVQEACQKWPGLKQKYPDIELHFMGSLQTNKVKDAVKIFDVIETLDRESLALSIQKHAPNLPCYIQVNTGEEEQKSGIFPKDFDSFFNFCTKECGLNIQGLMCIPPADEPPSPHFALLSNIAKRHNITNLSMGMSNDYPVAIKLGSTQIRIGTAIFS